MRVLPLADVVTPDVSLYGTDLNTVASAALGFAVLCCFGGIVIGAVMWAYGASTGSAETESRGKRSVVGSIAGAFVCGGLLAFLMGIIDMF